MSEPKLFVFLVWKLFFICLFIRNHLSILLSLKYWSIEIKWVWGSFDQHVSTAHHILSKSVENCVCACVWCVCVCVQSVCMCVFKENLNTQACRIKTCRKCSAMFNLMKCYLTVWPCPLITSYSATMWPMISSNSVTSHNTSFEVANRNISVKSFYSVANSSWHCTVQPVSTSHPTVWPIIPCYPTVKPMSPRPALRQVMSCHSMLVANHVMSSYTNNVILCW